MQARDHDSIEHEARYVSSMASKPSPNSQPKRELALLLIREARWHRQVEGGGSGSGSGSPVRLGLEPELDTMMEKETMATEKMVPFTMGTLDTKSIGLTSATIRARVYLRQGELSARGPCGAGRAMHAATQGAGGKVSGRRGQCRATWWAPVLKAVAHCVGERPKKLGHGRQKKACAGKGGEGQLVRTLNRVPASRSDHQTIGTNIKA